jgi:hypothetical protein
VIHPNRAVVDTNVLIVANGKADHASCDCVMNSVDFLDHARRNAIVVLDAAAAIFDEYERYCSYRGQPGVGDRFFLHLHRSRADVGRVQFVDIHPDGNGSYDEVPTLLSKFDPSDQKFIAAVVADQRRSVIVNCVDSDWAEASAELDESGVQVFELCPDRIPRGGSDRGR